MIVGAANGEPKTVVDAIEAGADRLKEVRLNQMLPIRDRAHFEGKVKGIRHVSWFLSPHDKDAFHRGQCDLVPNNFSEVPALMRRTAVDPLVSSPSSPPDAHGWFSLGVNSEYSAAMIGEMPFFLEVNARMPRTYGENQIHVSQIDRLVRGRLPAGRDAAARGPRGGPQDRRAGRRADPRRVDDPGRDRRDPRPVLGRSGTTATSASTPSSSAPAWST